MAMDSVGVKSNIGLNTKIQTRSRLPEWLVALVHVDRKPW